MEQTTPSRFNELFSLFVSFIIILIILTTTFYNEPFTSLLWITIALYWTLIIPGYTLTRIWRPETDFLERFIISIPLSAALVGITSYYLGLFGIGLRIQTIILPASIIILALLLQKPLRQQII